MLLLFDGLLTFNFYSLPPQHYNTKMSVTVTIHEGEMKQIRRLIEAKTTKGQLYGLWTHSYQPVIQYIIGDPDFKERKLIKDDIKETHGLRHVGNWSTADAGKKS